MMSTPVIAAAASANVFVHASGRKSFPSMSVRKKIGMKLTIVVAIAVTLGYLASLLCRKGDLETAPRQAGTE